MRIKNDQAGLTLVELLVTILVASIVTLSATTVLLFGLRINNQSTKTSMGQNTVQVLMEALEDVAAEAKSLEIVSETGKWEIKNNGNVLFSYLSETQTIYSGATMVVAGERVGTPFLENVQESYVTLSSNGLLTIDVAMQQGNYTTSVYCRMTRSGDTTGMDIIDYLRGVSDLKEGIVITESTNRLTFLKILAGEYGSKGQISETSEYYAAWYKSQKKLTGEGWDENTPWCACYLSWAMNQLDENTLMGEPLCEANVQTLKEKFSGNLWKTATSTGVVSGDLIFFNFDEDAESDHVGVVLTIDGSYIYTIEGNTAGRVAVRKYAVGDTRIMGYGVLNWK